MNSIPLFDVNMTFFGGQFLLHFNYSNHIHHKCHKIEANVCYCSQILYKLYSIMYTELEKLVLHIYFLENSKKILNIPKSFNKMFKHLKSF